MDILSQLIDLFLNLDEHLNTVVQNYGIWTYGILTLVIFLETGIVATPFLPGDSLLFAAGAIAALGSIDIGLLILLLATAAILGDTVNYWIGRKAGPLVFSKEKSLFFNKDYLRRAYDFYEIHGAKTIVIARFIPIIRTFAPFVAGIGHMNYLKFLAYNVAGGILWVMAFSLAGYFFGNIPIIKENFGLVIIGIIIVSLVPTVLEFIKHRRKPTIIP
ncbi:MAG: DedA family protein [bacterium]|nr:DedA family protein [bacterium]